MTQPMACARCKTALHEDETKCWRGCDAGLVPVEGMVYFSKLGDPEALPEPEVSEPMPIVCPRPIRNLVDADGYADLGVDVGRPESLYTPEMLKAAKEAEALEVVRETRRQIEAYRAEPEAAHESAMAKQIRRNGLSRLICEQVSAIAKGSTMEEAVILPPELRRRLAEWKETYL